MIAKIKYRFLGVFLFFCFSKPVHAGEALRNPALLGASIPVISLLIGVLVTSVFYSDEKKSEVIAPKVLNEMDRSQLKANILPVESFSTHKASFVLR
ncbi:MAG: hypothetical protein JWQ35_2796 [Bacteriovoracaceae bacterium]|nr:hypothetical protein [Bacteriovoracaceae bacterium]